MNFLIRSLCNLRFHNHINQLYHSHHRSYSYLAIKLSNRKIIRVCGEDSVIYLQSLITNDVRHLLVDEHVQQRNCIYAFMLSSLGRVLCELILYKGKIQSEGELLMEIDMSVANAMKRFLWGYSIGRQITVEVANDINAWVLIPQCDDAIGALQEIVSDDLILVQDPRIPQIGYRFLTRIGGNTFEDIKRYIDAPLKEGKLSDYQRFRYQLGVNEGFDDVPSQTHFLFECNADYLNGVNINKGLYVAEELSTKVYSGLSTLSPKGRKRIMPIEFLCDKTQLLTKKTPPGTEIITDRMKTDGVLLNSRGKYGLAIFNCNKILRCNELIHVQSGIRLRTWIPQWWPQNMNPFLIEPSQTQPLLNEHLSYFIEK